jgi:hypothetical protein
VKDIVHVGTTSGVLTTPSWLTPKSIQLTRELVLACDDDPRVNDRMLQKSWSSPPASYIEWLNDMLTYYPAARKYLSFDYRSGTEQLLGLIEGLSTLKRRIPQMDESQTLSLIVNSFALLRGGVRSQRNHFYIGLDEITLRDDALAVTLSSIAPDDRQRSVAVLTAMVEGRKSEPLRAAEIEAALRGDQATVLRQGAL